MILAINTASENVSIALYQPGKIAEEFSWISYRTQSAELLPKINQLLKDNDLTLKDIKKIAVFQGPGSYTGLRVGIAAANSLAVCLSIPIMGYKSSNNISAFEIAKKVFAKENLSKKIVLPFYLNK